MMLKDLILKKLEDTRGEFVSGEALAEAFGVSRNAVWKCIKRLEKEGYAVTSVKNRGYALSSQGDELSAFAVEKYLREGAFFVEVKKSTFSTNDDVKKLAAQGAPAWSAVIAEEQAGGRGRFGRAFYSPAGNGLYMSVLLRPHIAAGETLFITACAAVAVAEAVEKLCKKKDILLMIDEVQTGNGRTGTLYAFQQYGISPDVMTTAKGLGNGLPIGATLFSAKCEKTLTPGTHGSTFGGNPAACAGAVAVIKSINDKLLKGVEEKALRIRETLLACSKVKSVSGLGLMIGAEVENAAELKKQCLQKGLVVLTAKDRLRLLPPLNIGNDELERGLAILREVLK